MVSVSRTNRSRHRTKDDMSLVLLIAVVAGFFAFFLAAEAIFYLRPHPWHWLAALAGAVLGYGAGKIWYRHKGDVI